jgi:nicotinate-nucleotide adenylyltransferase
MYKRIGIFAGTFDPVHAGHIAFALQAIKTAELDRVYFMPERRPRNKQSVEHYAHRVAMLKQAFRPHPLVQVLEFVDINFSVDRTLPKIKALFPGDDVVLLFGSDVISGVSQWPNASVLLQNCSFVIGLRGKDSSEQIEKVIRAWPSSDKTRYIISSYAPSVSSSAVRQALRGRSSTRGILRSVERYSNKHWLYISLA